MPKKLGEILRSKCLDSEAIVDHHIRQIEIRMTALAENGEHSGFYPIPVEAKGLVPTIISKLAEEGLTVRSEEYDQAEDTIHLWIIWYE